MKITIENKRVKRIIDYKETNKINGMEWTKPIMEHYYRANNMLVARKRRRGKLRGIELDKIWINESVEIDKDCCEKLLKQINNENNNRK